MCPVTVMSNWIVYIFVSKDYKKGKVSMNFGSYQRAFVILPTKRTLTQGYVNDNGMSVNIYFGWK